MSVRDAEDGGRQCIGVDDGSTDGTHEEIERIAVGGDCVVVIRQSPKQPRRRIAAAVETPAFPAGAELLSSTAAPVLPELLRLREAPDPVAGARNAAHVVHRAMREIAVRPPRGAPALFLDRRVEATRPELSLFRGSPAKRFWRSSPT